MAESPLLQACKLLVAPPAYSPKLLQYFLFVLYTTIRETVRVFYCNSQNDNFVEFCCFLSIASVFGILKSKLSFCAIEQPWLLEVIGGVWGGPGRATPDLLQNLQAILAVIFSHISGCFFSRPINWQKKMQQK